MRPKVKTVEYVVLCVQLYCISISEVVKKGC